MFKWQVLTCVNCVSISPRSRCSSLDGGFLWSKSMPHPTTNRLCDFHVNLVHKKQIKPWFLKDEKKEKWGIFYDLHVNISGLSVQSFMQCLRNEPGCFIAHHPLAYHKTLSRRVQYPWWKLKETQCLDDQADIPCGRMTRTLNWSIKSSRRPNQLKKKTCLPFQLSAKFQALVHHKEVAKTLETGWDHAVWVRPTTEQGFGRICKSNKVELS